MWNGTGMDREENATVIDRRYRMREEVGRFVAEDSVGGTPTEATGTVALPRVVNDRSVLLPMNPVVACNSG